MEPVTRARRQGRRVVILGTFGALSFFAGLALLSTAREPLRRDADRLTQQDVPSWRSSRNVAGASRRLSEHVVDDSEDAPAEHDEAAPSPAETSELVEDGEDGVATASAEEPDDTPIEGTSAEEEEEEAAAAEGSEREPLEEGSSEGEELEREEGEEGAEGEGGEEGEECEGEECEVLEAEEEGVEKVNLAIALTLLGAVSFVMALFTMVNTEDEDMRLYVWQVISSTISIFMAVLFFSSVNALVHEIITEKFQYTMDCQMGRFVHAVGDVIEMCTYYVLMQVLVGYCSGALRAKAIDPTLEKRKRFGAEFKNVRVPEEEQQQAIERRMKSAAVLLSHTSGFAAINVGGMFQHGAWIRERPVMSLLVVPFMFLLLIGMGRLARRIRLIVQVRYHDRRGRPEATYQGMPLTQDDLREDGAGGAHRDLTVRNGELQRGDPYRHELMEKWDECVYESENEICALAVSFLVVQATRFLISGVLPDYLGNEESGPVHTQMNSIYLLFAGIGFAALCCIVVTIGGPDRHTATPGSFMSFIARCHTVAQDGSAMAFAWCLLVVCRWESGRLAVLGDPNGIICRVVIALMVSFCGFFIILGLDFLADLSITGDKVDAAIVSIIEGLSILVGFSWEQSFDGGVEVIAELTPNPIQIQLCLAVAVMCVVMEPWRRYILKKVIILRADRDARNVSDEQAHQLQERFRLASDNDLRKEVMRRGLHC